VLSRLHTGSWIDADFHIWIGHAEKNRGWDWIARTRAALVDAGQTPERSPRAWEALYAAEGSDWFWWFGDDHYTTDKTLFDQLFRLQLHAVYERAGLPIPCRTRCADRGRRAADRTERTPLGFLSPTIDGERTGFYEWHGAARYRFTGGGTSMHQGAGLASDLYFGVDARRLHLRVDFTGGPPGEEHALLLEFLSPAPARVLVGSLGAGNPTVKWSGGARDGQRVEGGHAAVRSLAEVSIPFDSLGWSTGQPVEWLVRILHRGQPVETLPGDDVIRFPVPAPEDAARMWSA
jgi:hypothetical protein